MLVNLLKSKVLPPVLRRIIETLYQLSAHDAGLDMVINRLGMFLQHPEYANAPELMHTLDQAKDIAISYGVKANHELSEMLFVVKIELEDLLTQEKIKHSTEGQSSAGTDVVAMADQFYLLTLGK
jgi:hypothetical protein